jgi:hypothetical protein
MAQVLTLRQRRPFDGALQVAMQGIVPWSARNQIGPEAGPPRVWVAQGGPAAVR